MPINAYTGLMGSGKSLEVVGYVALPAFEKGRTIVSNIEGLNEEEFRKYLRKAHSRKYNLAVRLIFKLAGKPIPELDETKWGKIIVVSDDEVRKARFFPTDDRKDAVVSGGDLVIIDEAWKIWGVDKEPLPEHLEFFTKHRHYVNEETKQTCDLAICVQDLGLIHKKLKVLLEQCNKTTKFKFVGAPKKYRVDIYQSYRMTKAHLITNFYRTYDKNIFPLYHSYAGGTGNEQNIDKRINVFRSGSFIVPIVVAVCGLTWGVSYIYGWLNPKPKDAQVSEKKDSPQNSDNKKNGAYGTTSPTVVQNNAASPSVQNPSQARLLGILDLSSKRYAVIEKDGRERLIHISNCNSRGYEMVCDVDNQKTSFYSGSIKGANNGQSRL